MASYTSSGSGNWNNVATWGGGGFPVAGDTATIANTHNVNLNVDSASATVIVNSGGTITVTTNNAKLTITSAFTLNGIWACGSNGCYLTLGNSAVTIGSGADITGDGSSVFRTNLNSTSGTYTNNKTGAFSISGLYSMDMTPSVSNIGWTGDFSNADYKVNGVSSDRNVTFASGTIKCKKFFIFNNSNNSITFDNNTNNPSFECSGDVLFNDGSGSYTTNWTKGTGSITLVTGDATTKSIDFDGQAIEDLIILSTNDSDIKQLTGNVSSLGSDLNVTDGKLDIGVHNCIFNDLTISGKLVIGTSLGFGFGGSDLDFSAIEELDMQTGSKVNCYGDFDMINDVSVWTNNNRGYFIKTGNGNYNHNAARFWDGFELSAGVTMTGTSGFVRITNNDSLAGVTMGNNSVINFGTKYGNWGGYVLLIGTGCDIQGSNTIDFNFQSSVTNNTVSVMSFTGLMKIKGNSGAPIIPGGRWDNANLQVESVNSRTFAFGQDITVNDYKVNLANGSPTIDNTGNNINTTVIGDVDFDLNDPGGNSLTYNAGSGTFKGAASSGTVTWDLQGKTVESIELDCSGAIVQPANNFTTNNVTLTNGTLAKNGKTITVNGNLDVNSGSTSGTGKFVLAGTGKTCSANGKAIGNVDVTGTYTFDESFIISDFNVTGTGTFDYSKTYAVTNVAGNGTLISQDANVVTITYTGASTWSGVLTNVILVGPSDTDFAEGANNLVLRLDIII